MGAPMSCLLGLGLVCFFPHLFQSLQAGMVAWLDLGWNSRRGQFCAVLCRAWYMASENGRVVGGGGQAARSEGEEGGRGQSRVGWIRDQSWKKIRWCVLPRYQRRRACLGQSARHRSWILQLPRQRAETVAANDRRYSPCTSFAVSPGTSCKPPEGKCQGLQLSLVWPSTCAA